jgi:hypothetical protein
MSERHLSSWADGPSKSAIVDFVTRATAEGSGDFVAPVERIAVFDNNGTLWCEKQMPIELGFKRHSRTSTICSSKPQPSWDPKIEARSSNPKGLPSTISSIAPLPSDVIRPLSRSCSIR